MVCPTNTEKSNLQKRYSQQPGDKAHIYNGKDPSIDRQWYWQTEMVMGWGVCIKPVCSCSTVFDEVPTELDLAFVLALA